MQVAEKFLEEYKFQELKNIISSNSFGWSFNEVSVYNSDAEVSDLKNYQFTHVLYDNSKPVSEFYDYFLNNFFINLNFSVLLRAKINLNVNIGEIKEKPFHTDIPTFMAKKINYNTGIFYFNTNNGYTKFKTGEMVKSIENRFLFFNGNTPHCGSTCTDDKKRIVLNVNWI